METARKVCDVGLTNLKALPMRDSRPHKKKIFFLIKLKMTSLDSNNMLQTLAFESKSGLDKTVQEK